MSTLSDQFRSILAGYSLQDHKLLKIYFDGAGDSGDIQDIVITDDDHWSANTITIQGKERKLIEDSFYDFFNDKINDWYNNEGGYGEVTIDLSEGSWLIQANYRVLETETYSGTLAEL